MVNLFIDCLNFPFFLLALQNGLEIKRFVLFNLLFPITPDTVFFVHSFSCVISCHISVYVEEEVGVYLEFDFRGLRLMVLDYWDYFLWLLYILGFLLVWLLYVFRLLFVLWLLYVLRFFFFFLHLKLVNDIVLELK